MGWPLRPLENVNLGRGLCSDRIVLPALPPDLRRNIPNLRREGSGSCARAWRDPSHGQHWLPQKRCRVLGDRRQRRRTAVLPLQP